MAWFAKLLRRRQIPPPAPPPLPEGWTTSQRQYPAAVIVFPAIREYMARTKDLRLNWDAKKKSFTIEAPREKYQIIVPLLVAARRQLKGQ